ncbi:acyltransferase family protein [Undibacterium sp. Ren11W]|uniref:acyltransferase family protein n=1 Tax=Undibacterium sp. Ren11W TaxID=3413045 RepID=UPI003BF400A8
MTHSIPYLGASTTRIPELDGMRGIAILLVMVFHSNLAILKGGFIGVDIFFVLSGFLITVLLLEEFDENNTITLNEFYFRRFLRLAPALLLLLSAVAILSSVFLSGVDRKDQFIDVLISLLNVSNWARAFSLHPPTYLGHTWSLSLEAQFYFIWPLVFAGVLKTSRSRCHLVLLGLIVGLWGSRIYLALNGTSFERLYNGLDTRMDMLLSGSLLAVLLRSNLVTFYQKKIALVLKYIAPVSALLLLWISAVADWRELSFYYWGMPAIEILVCSIILNIRLVENSFLKNILSNKLFVWIGGISYGLYLWHYPVYALMTTLKFTNLTILVVGSAITFILAFLSSCLIEKPIIRRGKKYLVMS